MGFTKRDPIVLFVDDEPAVLSSLRRCFRNEPCTVFTAASPREAFAWLEQAPIDLVVADERMPEMTGTDLLREIRRRSPKTSRALLTGYPGDALIRQGLEAGADTFLYKPWDDETLRRTVRRVLAEGPPAEMPLRLKPDSRVDLGGESGT